jgi:endonuclease YncB( thermonuclease family)
MDNQNLKLIQELNSLDSSKIKKFSLENYETLIKIIKIIDGDTITALFKYKDEFFKYNFRLNNIDTAEIHSKNANVKQFALETKQYLFNLIINKNLQAKFLNFDKYGRILIDIYLENGETVSNNLIKGGYAKKYNGGTKDEWEL